MKKKRIIPLSIAMLICLLATAGAWKHLHRIHAEQVAVWNEVARETFKKALIIEVEKLGNIEIPIFTYYPGGMRKLVTPVPDSATVEIDELGKKKFCIPREKYDNSLIKERSQAGLLGYLLEEYPLSLDTLNLHWDSLLLVHKVPAQTYIRYTYTDFWEHDSVAYSRLPDKKVYADSLLSYYMGGRVEHEATGFIAYRVNLVSAGWWCAMALLWGCLLAGAFYCNRLYRWLQRKFVRHEVTVQEKIVEKEVYVAKVDASPAERYDLGEGVCFDTKTQTLCKGEKATKLSPQIAILLKLFLKAKEHRLTTEEIYREIWNGRGTQEKLHTSIYRLRKTLEGVSSLSIRHEGNGVYRLQRLGEGSVEKSDGQ